MSDLVERLKRTNTEYLMRPAFGGILLDTGEEIEVPVNPDGPEAAAHITTLEADKAALVERNDALSLQADEWEGKYAIVSEMNAALVARVAELEALIERTALIVERNLYRQHEKIEDVPKLHRAALNQEPKP